MARITVEDCLDHVDNRFELVMVGSKRAAKLLPKAVQLWFLKKMTSPQLSPCVKSKRVLVTADILTEVRQDYEIVDADADDEDGEAISAAEAGAETSAEAVEASEPPQEPSI